MAAMAALMEEETAAYPELRRGEIIEGVVVGTDRDGILVDIGAKSEGVVPPQEMHCLQPEGSARLSPGDKVLVFVVQPESPEGQIILSLDRARGERGWRVLQEYLDQNQAFEAYVTGSNKGGLLVNVEGVNAFVPLSQIVGGPDRGSPENTQRALSEWVGRTITLKVIELNRRRNRAILSERAAMQERRAAEKERLLQELEEGDVKTGRITSIRDFGIFVDIGGADGLVHLSELSWERTPKSPHELFKVGDEVPVYVLKVDNETKKIALSVRRAQPERWDEIASRYREGQIVPGQVTKLAPFGAFVRLDGPIEGLIHISELVDRRINHPKEVVDEGDAVPVKIVRIEYDRHRLGLSLRQARDKAEEDGWVFTDAGRTVSAPEDVLEQLGLDSARATLPDAEVAQAETPVETGAAVEELSTDGVSPAEEPQLALTAPEIAADVPEADVAVEVEEEVPAEPEAPLEVEAEAEELEIEEEAAADVEVEEETAEEPEVPVEVAEAEEVEVEEEAAADAEVEEETAAEPDVPVEVEAEAEEVEVEEEAADAEVEEETAAEPDVPVEVEAEAEELEEAAARDAEVEGGIPAQAEASLEVETEAEEPVAQEAAATEEATGDTGGAAEEAAVVTEMAPDALNTVEESESRE